MDGVSYSLALFLCLWDSVSSGRMLGADGDGGAELGVPVRGPAVHHLLPGDRLCVSSLHQDSQALSPSEGTEGFSPLWRKGWASSSRRLCAHWHLGFSELTKALTGHSAHPH